MPAYYVDDSLYYCSLCDKYFPTIEARSDHLQWATNHPKCDKCNIHFANLNSLRNHYTISDRHNYCSSCVVHFRTRAGIHAHIELSSLHGGGDRTHDEDDDVDFDDSYEGWEDDVGAERYPDMNDFNEPPVSMDLALDPDDEYWPEDDQPHPEDELYSGYAPVDMELRRQTAARMVCGIMTLSKRARDFRSGAANTQETSAPSGSLCLYCPICLDSTSTPTATECGHVFCKTCIRSSLHVESSCPVCRKQANVGDLRTLFVQAMPVAAES
ncbi:hypothetical protein BD413DRAFT_468178 [Trametes elegans]|nr:hypothetical protein BD413DRAFT_468178 [Trametes elegans]